MNYRGSFSLPWDSYLKKNYNILLKVLNFGDLTMISIKYSKFHFLLTIRFES